MRSGCGECGERTEASKPIDDELMPLAPWLRTHLKTATKGNDRVEATGRAVGAFRFRCLSDWGSWAC